MKKLLILTLIAGLSIPCFAAPKKKVNTAEARKAVELSMKKHRSAGVASYLKKSAEATKVRATKAKQIKKPVAKKTK